MLFKFNTKMHLLLSLFLFLFLFLMMMISSSWCLPAASNNNNHNNNKNTTTTTNSYYNIVELGAVGDGKTDSGRALMEAWSAACASPNPATIHVPPSSTGGPFLLPYNLHFKGPCQNNAILFRIQATLLLLHSPNNNNNYNNNHDYWFLFDNVDGVSIHGGTLHAQGSALWSCKKKKSSPPSSNNAPHCPTGATTLGILNSRNVRISGLRSSDSEMFHIVINGCQNVKLQGVTVAAPADSPNTDGIHIQLSTSVTLVDTQIGTGDDCISIGPGTTNLWVQNVACGPGHGISIGSLGKDYEEAGVENITVTNATFRDHVQNGFRIKTWGRPSKGFVRNVLFQHANMLGNHVDNPIIIDQNYCPSCHSSPSPSSSSSGIKISGVTYRDIRGTSATQVAVKFDCSKANPCEGLRLEDVSLSYINEPAAAAGASCSNAGGTTAGRIQPTSCLLA